MTKSISNKYLIAVIIILLTLEVCTVFFYRKSVISRENSENAPQDELEQKNREIETLKQNIAELRAKSQVIVSAAQACPTAVVCPAVTEAKSDSAAATLNSSALEYAASARVSAIAKFVELSDQQKTKLKEKYVNEISGNTSNNTELEDIIGKENADFYRERKRQAFEQIQSEALEKEVLFISRLMQLNNSEEEQLRAIYLAVESDAELKNKNSNNSMQQIIEEEKAKELQLRDKISAAFSPDQYKAFVDYQSKQQNMGMWHGD